MKAVSKFCLLRLRRSSWRPAGLLLASWVLTLCPLQSQQQPDSETKLEPVRTSITVVERVSTEAPANITEVSGAQVQNTAGTNLDDRLRYVPGFSLFRRTSSLVANPTTQGVSLRGIGSSGASRTLVLWEGIPINDPFGGWVYWTRIDPSYIDRVEIDRGASTSVFGDRALSGAIALFSRAPKKLHLLADYSAGNQNTHDFSAGFSNLWR